MEQEKIKNAKQILDVMDESLKNGKPLAESLQSAFESLKLLDENVVLIRDGESLKSVWNSPHHILVVSSEPLTAQMDQSFCLAGIFLRGKLCSIKLCGREQSVAQNMKALAKDGLIHPHGAILSAFCSFLNGEDSLFVHLGKMDTVDLLLFHHCSKVKECIACDLSGRMPLPHLLDHTEGVVAGEIRAVRDWIATHEKGLNSVNHEQENA
jgi:hypothetical protein